MDYRNLKKQKRKGNKSREIFFIPGVFPKIKHLDVMMGTDRPDMLV